MNDLHADIKRLSRLSLCQLRDEFETITGEVARSNNRTFLIKRIAWRRQADREGGLSDRARTRARELARECDLRVRPRADVSEAFAAVAEPGPQRPKPLRLPAGTVVSRVYRGRTIEAKVVADGVEYGGTIYRSLTAVAKVVTGTHWNGRLFFGLSARGGVA